MHDPAAMPAATDHHAAPSAPASDDAVNPAIHDAHATLMVVFGLIALWIAAVAIFIL